MGSRRIMGCKQMKMQGSEEKKRHSLTETTKSKETKERRRHELGGKTGGRTKPKKGKAAKRRGDIFVEVFVRGKGARTEEKSRHSSSDPKRKTLKGREVGNCAMHRTPRLRATGKKRSSDLTPGARSGLGAKEG